MQTQFHSRTDDRVPGARELDLSVARPTRPALALSVETLEDRIAPIIAILIGMNQPVASTSYFGSGTWDDRWPLP